MKLRGEMQEMTLKYENQTTISSTLESAKTKISHQFQEIQKEHTVLIAENERLQREIYTKEQLLIS